MTKEGEHMRKLRAERRAWGICTKCGGARDRNDRVLCAACRAREVRRNLKYRAYYAAYRQRKREERKGAARNDCDT